MRHSVRLILRRQNSKRFWVSSKCKCESHECTPGRRVFANVPAYQTRKLVPKGLKER